MKKTKIIPDPRTNVQKTSKGLQYRYCHCIAGSRYTIPLNSIVGLMLATSRRAVNFSVSVQISSSPSQSWGGWPLRWVTLSFNKAAWGAGSRPEEWALMSHHGNRRFFVCGYFLSSAYILLQQHNTYIYMYRIPTTAKAVMTKNSQKKTEKISIYKNKIILHWIWYTR